MESRVAAIETILANLPNQFAEAIDHAFETRLPVYFEQFRREQAARGGGEGPSAPSFTDLPPHRDMDRIHAPHSPVTPGSATVKPPWSPRIDFPRFGDGDDLLSWIYKAEQFFVYYGIPASQRVVTASFHLEGEILQWYRWMDCSNTTPCWEDFTQALCKEFGPSEFDDSTEALFKLRQTGTLRDYIAEFRKLANRTCDVGPLLLKSCFLGGLKRELKYDVKLLKPHSVHDAIAIAVQLDTKFQELKGGIPKPSPTVPKHHPNTTTAINPYVPRVQNYPVKKLSPADIQLKRDKGECWFCTDKWVPGHKCGLKQLLMLDVADQAELDAFPPDSPPEVHHMELSECAFYGTTATPKAQTMKVQGTLQGHSVRILLDSGSTHNFVDTRLLKQWGQPVHPTKSFEVMIADGGKVQSSGCWRSGALSLGGYTCSVDLYSLPLGGCDLVLGVQWLSSISPVLWDFHHLTMAFTKDNQHYQLFHSAAPPSLIQEVSLQHLEKEVANSNLGLLLYSMETRPVLVRDCELSSAQSTQLHALLADFESLFVLPSQLPPSRSHDHHIPLLPGAKPPNIRPYHYGPLAKDEIERAVKDLLDAGFIRPSHSPFSFPVLLVRKKEGTWRMCIDYRELNALTIKNKYPIPLIDDLLDELCGATYFSKLDLRSGYHQILMQPADVEKTAFKTHAGHYEFLVMPFGLTNAPATFQQLMNDIFRPLLRKCVLVFFDDILIYSHSWADHMSHLLAVFQILQQHRLFLKKSKCSFGQQCVEYLGHIVSREGVAADPSKLQAIRDWPIPKTLKELRGFLGLTGYYRKFIAGYGQICQPLYQLTKKDKFYWTQEATETFNQLKDIMTSPPVLALPDFSKAFELECDASGNGIGAVLQQGGRPIAFTSQALGPKNQSLSTYERELIAIVYAVKKWHSYLQGRHFTIKTDHCSLKYFLSQKANTHFQQKWVSKLLGYDYEIQFRSGSDNHVADALSRVHGSPLLPECAAISYPHFGWFDELRQYNEHDSWIQSKAKEYFQAQETNATTPTSSNYSFQNGFLRYKARILLSPSSPWRTKLIEAYHSIPAAGHQGVIKTYHKLKKDFYWPSMKNDVKLFVSECHICQQHKYETVAPPGKLMPLPIPERIWADISMDFIVGLPNCKGKTVIMVVVDRLSKYSHFVPMAHPYTAASVAQLFLEHIFKLHGMPNSIVSDRDPIFISAFWKELFKLHNAKLCMSSGYHPQTDGQTEVMNRCLETYLRCFVGGQPKKWVQWLSWAEWCFNTSYHTSSKFTPFELVYGYSPPHITPYEPGSTKFASVEQCLVERDKVLEILKRNLELAQTRMKSQADQKRSERSFAVGDMVYIKLIPYQLQSLAAHSYHKLLPRFYGPYKVLSRVGDVAYKLELPAMSKVHPVFHVSSLKKHLGPNVVANNLLPQVTEDGLQQLVPASILARRMYKKGNSAGVQLLVQWQDQDASSATWEDFEDFQARFPAFSL
ncbi:hypothetical protein FF1_046837 [Malus domestica]